VFTTSSAILTVNCIVGGTGVSVGLHQAGLSKIASIVIAVLAGLALLVVLASYQVRQFKRMMLAVAGTS
jgi:hypothetical protein